LLTVWLIENRTGDTTEGASKLAETLADPKWGPSFVPVHSAWNKVTGQPMAMFDFWAQVRLHSLINVF
jgi:hypothetical protein